MVKSIILFSGIHGVRKEYLIKENTEDNDDIICLRERECRCDEFLKINNTMKEGA